MASTIRSPCAATRCSARQDSSRRLVRGWFRSPTRSAPTSRKARRFSRSYSGLVKLIALTWFPMLPVTACSVQNLRREWIFVSRLALIPLTRRRSFREVKGRFLMMARASFAESPSTAVRSTSEAVFTETEWETPAATFTATGAMGARCSSFHVKVLAGAEAILDAEVTATSWSKRVDSACSSTVGLSGAAFAGTSGTVFGGMAAGARPYITGLMKLVKSRVTYPEAVHSRSISTKCHSPAGGEENGSSKVDRKNVV